MSNIPLVTKYAPATLDSVVGHMKEVGILKAWVASYKQGIFDFPNLLLSGPAGTGKTSVAKAMARDMFGDAWRQCFLVLNASDERGIDVVRGKIKSLAQTKPMMNINIIFLDEADNLTHDAQFGLRTIMEDYLPTCRFILSCNYRNKVIEPIQSRCAVIQFGKVDTTEMMRMLVKVVRDENLQVTKEAAQRIIESSDGRPRNMLNLVNQLQGLGKPIDESTVTALTKNIHPYTEKSIMQNLARNPMECDKKIIEIVNDGVNPEDILSAIFDIIKDDKSLFDQQSRVKLLMDIGEVADRVNRGNDPLLQLRSFLWEMYHIMKASGRV